jgi:uncharacterized coiled-coil DUF342 family protein
MRINELGKRVSEWEAKLKQQQQLYESVRSDRNLYSKTLIEAQDEIAEMKRKFKIMNHQIEQLKVSCALSHVSFASVAAKACSSELGGRSGLDSDSNASCYDGGLLLR